MHMTTRTTIGDSIKTPGMKPQPEWIHPDEATIPMAILSASGRAGLGQSLVYFLAKS